MSSFPEAICPLCSQIFPHEKLYAHITSEHPHLRHNTIRTIQAYYPGWLEDHGACEACWKSFRNASQILSVLRSARPHNAGG